MPRTGQPAIRHVAAVERALAVLDALSDGEPELGTDADTVTVSVPVATTPHDNIDIAYVSTDADPC